MIGTWMFYCLLCAAGLSLAATLAERLLLAGRAPVRVVWIGALLLSLGIPVFAFSVAASSPAPAITIAPPSIPVTSAATVAVTNTPARSAIQTTTAARPWTAVVADRLRALDSTLLIVWVALSAALAVSLISGVLGLALMRRRWTQRVVQGVTVHVSRRTGPAVVGTFSPVIVVPEWSFSLAPEQLSLMLRHELEHLRARDGQLLIAAQIALIAMPWNVALWWQVLRLRVAIEMDCDARVLRVADARSYGELLLEVARPHRSLKLAGMIAFAERATQLERRIRVLKRHRVATSRRATIAASTIALVALSAAWVAPHPITPLHAAVTALPSASSLPLVVMHDVTAPAPMRVPVARPSALPTRAANIIRRAVEACANDTSVVGATYRFIYDGVSLTRDNESKACALLARLVDEQLAEDAVTEATMRDMRARRAAIQSQRDSRLMSLLKTDADRATFTTNLTRGNSVELSGGGRMGRSEGGSARAVFIGDTIAVAASREERAKLELEATRIAKGSGRVEMTTRTVNDGVMGSVTHLAVDTQGMDPERLVRMKTEMAAVMGRMVDLEANLGYARLFNGITLSPDDEQTARKMLVEAQQEMSAIPKPTIRPVTRLRVVRERGVALVGSGADSALIDLASTQADRDRVRSRIRAVQQ